MVSPVDGVVVAVNEEVMASPDILCSDPYGRGWLMEVRVPEPTRNQKNLLCGGLARAWMEQRIRDLRAYALPTPEPALVLPEKQAGPGCAGFARVLAPEVWEDVMGEMFLIRD
jgi:hypothetical protein